MEDIFTRYGFYLWAGGAVVTLATFVWAIWLHTRLSRVLAHYHRLVTGVDGTSLPATLDQHLERVTTASELVGGMAQRQDQLDYRIRGAVQHVGLVRFNPFEDTGGDQSFSLALLNAVGDGVVITSLFARDRTRVYAKPVTAGASKYHLTDEEDQAISLAGAPTVAASTLPAPASSETPVAAGSA